MMVDVFQRVGIDAILLESQMMEWRVGESSMAQCLLCVSSVGIYLLCVFIYFQKGLFCVHVPKLLLHSVYGYR